MTTRAAFREDLRLQLSDRSLWRDSMLNQWIDDAINEYSINYPTQTTVTFDGTGSTRTFTFTNAPNVLNIARVEYPVGKTPPVFINQRAQGAPDFYSGPFYDVIGNPITAIILGQTPTAAEDVKVTYQTVYTLPTLDSSTLTVPDYDLELLRLYVVWKAVSHLELSADVVPERKAALVASLGLNAVRAERLYRNRLRDTKLERSKGGWSGPWSVDSKDRVY